MQYCLEPQGQHCVGYLLVQCCSKIIKTTLNRSFLLCIVVWSLLDNIAQGFYLFNVGKWLTNNFYEENNLYNVVSTKRYKKPPLSQYVRWSWNKKHLFTENLKRGLYKKAHLIQYLRWSWQKKFFLLKMVVGS